MFRYPEDGVVSRDWAGAQSSRARYAPAVSVSERAKRTIVATLYALSLGVCMHACGGPASSGGDATPAAPAHEAGTGDSSDAQATEDVRFDEALGHDGSDGSDDANIGEASPLCPAGGEAPEGSIVPPPRPCDAGPPPVH